MGRRKKEPPTVHRANIAAAASGLFEEKGIAAATMDDIAKASGYSKATLYVYFKDKEEIIGFLVLESMKKLYDYISLALEQNASARARYDSICQGLVRYQEEFPFYFKTVLDKIRIDFENNEVFPEEIETYRIGESINEKLKEFLLSGMENGELRNDLDIFPTIFTFWGTLSGLILLSSSKEEYLKSAAGLSKKQFLEYGFDMLYRTVANTVCQNDIKGNSEDLK